MTIILEKQRAKRAWDRVREISALPQKVQGRYRSQVRGGMATIQRNGLGQYLAFLASKGFTNKQLTPVDKEADHADGLLYQHLGGWMLKAAGVVANEPMPQTEIVPGAGKVKDPLSFLLDQTTTLEQMMWATREVLAFLQWARRFAESQLQTSKDQDP